MQLSISGLFQIPIFYLANFNGLGSLGKMTESYYADF